MDTTTPLADPRTELDCVAELPRAAVLLHPLRLKILCSFDVPKSATDVAGELRLPRQKVNYHVQRLARARFLKRAGRRQRRGLRDQCFVQSARTVLMLPRVLGPLAPDARARNRAPGHAIDAMSATYLLALSATLQKELGVAWREAHDARQNISTLAIDAELRFTSPRQRALFTAALHAAVARVIAEHASPMHRDDGARAAGRPYRLVVGAYPIPAVFEN